MDKMIVSGSTATTDDLEFFMTDTTDHVTGKTGLSPTVTIRKPGGAFGSPSGAVSEIAKGWYRVAANATDNNTNGALLLNATAAGADPSDKSFQIVPWNIYDGVRLGLTALPNAVAGASGGLVPIGTGANTFKSDASANVTFANTSIATVTNQLSAAAIATGIFQDTTAGDFTVAGSIGKSIMNGVALGTGLTVNDITTKTGYSLTQAFPANFAAGLISAAGYYSSDTKKMNGTTVNGTGAAGDLWRG